MSLRLSDLVKRDLGVDPVITGVTADSRKVRPGFLFAALPGSKVDGRSFAPKAAEMGAAAILAGLVAPHHYTVGRTGLMGHSPTAA